MARHNATMNFMIHNYKLHQSRKSESQPSENSSVCKEI
jgi:hypothetical protein